jgi:hypothetical protein
LALPGKSCKLFLQRRACPAVQGQQVSAELRDAECYQRDFFADGRLIRNRGLVHDKYYRLKGVDTVPLPDPKSHFGAGHQNIEAVLGEVERLGIPRVL